MSVGKEERRSSFGYRRVCRRKWSSKKACLFSRANAIRLFAKLVARLFCRESREIRRNRGLDSPTGKDCKKMFQKQVDRENATGVALGKGPEKCRHSTVIVCTLGFARGNLVITPK